MPAPTSTSVPPRFSCASADFHRDRVARALERDVERLVDDVVRHRGVDSSSGVIVRAPSCSPSARRRGVRLAHDDVVDARAPRSAATASSRSGPPPVTSTRCPACTPPRVMPCSATASGSASAACCSDRPSGTRSGSSACDAHVARRTRPASRRPCRVRPARRTATGGRRGSTRTRRTRRRAADDRVADLPAGHVGADRDDACPSTRGPRSSPAVPQPSSTKCRSEPQTPQWLTSSSTSSGPSSGTGSLLDRDLAGPMKTAASQVTVRRHARQRRPNLTRASRLAVIASLRHRGRHAADVVDPGRDRRRRDGRARPAGPMSRSTGGRDHRDRRRPRRQRRELDAVRPRRDARASSTSTRTTTRRCSGTRRSPRRPGTASRRSSPATAASRSRRAGPSTASCSSHAAARRGHEPRHAARPGSRGTSRRSPSTSTRSSATAPSLNYAAYVGHTAVRLFVMGDDGYERERPPTTSSRAMPTSCARRSRRARPASRRARRRRTTATAAGRCRRASPTSHELEALLAPLRELGQGVGRAARPARRVKHADVYDAPAARSAARSRGPRCSRSRASRGTSDHGRAQRTRARRGRRGVAAGLVPAAHVPDEPARAVHVQHGARVPGAHGPPARGAPRRVPRPGVARQGAATSSRTGASSAAELGRARRSRRAERTPSSIGRTVADIAEERGVEPLDVDARLSLDENLETRFRSVLANNDPEAIEWLLQQEGMLLGLADSGAHVSQLCDACLPTDLLGNWVRDERCSPLERAVHKLTGEPAGVFGFDATAGALARGQGRRRRRVRPRHRRARAAAAHPRLPRRRRAPRRRPADAA